MICCADIMTLPSLKKLKLIAGEAGLNRPLRWVHVLDMPDVFSWVQGGELLIMTGISVQHDTPALLKIVEGIAKENLAGLVINIGPYIPSVPPEVIELADSLAVPLFTLPWKVKLVEVTKDASSYIITKQMEEKAVRNLLENILFEEVADYSLLAGRASHYGYDLDRPFRIAVLHCENFTTFLREQGIRDEIGSDGIKGRLKQMIEHTLTSYNYKPLSLIDRDSIIFLIPSQQANYREEYEVTAIIRNLLEKVTRNFPGLNVQVGLSMVAAKLSDFRQGMEQAEQALHFMFTAEIKGSYCYFEQLGIYKLLFKLAKTDLSLFYDETIGLLDQYDSLHGTQLVHNLMVLLDVNGNYNHAAELLFVHRNTLKYRLQKIEEITGRSLAKNQDRTDLQIGIVAGKVLGVKAVQSTA
jgi:sugar diacid utilization regulator